MLHIPRFIPFAFTLVCSLTVGPFVARAAGSEAPIVGGTPVPAGRWPDVAAVVLRDGICTGTLIAPDVVLTAGHCVEAVPLEVVLDSVDYARAGGERIRVAWAQAYPDWRHRYDAGVLVLERPARTKPRRIAARCTARAEIFAGQSVTVAGFGVTGSRGTEATTRLHEAAMSITDASCTRDPSCQPAIAPDGEFMAGGRGTDACFGDSGGPVYVDTPGGPALIGVVSRGLSLPGAPCGGGGVHVRLDPIAPWIERVTRRRLARTSCGGRADAEDAADGDGCAAAGGAGAAFGLALLGAVTAARARSRTRRRGGRGD
jgi:secreted trypsin-like serine protease